MDKNEIAWLILCEARHTALEKQTKTSVPVGLQMLERFRLTCLQSFNKKENLPVF